MKKYPFVKQEGIKDCGVACLSMIIKYYKGYVNYERLIDMTKTDKSGTTALNLIEAAKELGFKASGIKTSLHNENCKTINLPCIAHVIINKTYKHYVIIYQIDYKKEQLLVADPNDKIKRISFKKFEEIWSGVLILMYPFKTIPILDNKTTSMSFLINLISMFKKDMLVLILMSLFITIFSIISSFYFKCLIDQITNINNGNYLVLIFIIFGCCYLIKILTNYFRNQMLIYTNQKIDLALTTSTFKKIILFPYHYYRNRTTGEIVSRMNDINIIRETVSRIIITVCIDLLLASISLIVLFIINFNLAAIATLIFIINMVLIVVFQHIFSKHIEDCKLAKDETNSYMIETIGGFETIKGLGIESKAIKKFNNKYLQQTEKIKSFNIVYNQQQLLKELVNEMGNIIILFIGINFVLNNHLTLGSLIAFSSLLNYFLDPVQNIIDFATDMKEVKIVFRRVCELNFDDHKNNINLLKEIQGNVVVNHLNYSYNSDTKILQHVNLRIKQGNKVIVLGKSGSGKSTLFKIIMKYHSIGRNQLYIDGVDINDISSETIKQGITYISQNEVLFTDTVYNNILLSNDCDNDKLKLILDICQINDIIKNEQLGLNKLVEENGFNFSGGEKQRLILARSLIKKFNMLIIDEGLNQIDVNLERKILKQLFQVYQDKTIIVISHRRDNIDLYDQMIEFKPNRKISSIVKHG